MSVMVSLPHPVGSATKKAMSIVNTLPEIYDIISSKFGARSLDPSSSAISYRNEILKRFFG